MAEIDGRINKNIDSMQMTHRVGQRIKAGDRIDLGPDGKWRPQPQAFHSLALWGISGADAEVDDLLTVSVRSKPFDYDVTFPEPDELRRLREHMQGVLDGIMRRKRELEAEHGIPFAVVYDDLISLNEPPKTTLTYRFVPVVAPKE